MIFRQGVGNPLRGEKARRKQCRGKFGLALRGLAVVIPDSQLQCVVTFLVQRRTRIADGGALAACDAPADCDGQGGHHGESGGDRHLRNIDTAV